MYKKIEAKYIPFADFKKQWSIGATADELLDIAIIDSPEIMHPMFRWGADVSDKVDTIEFYDDPIKSCSLDDGTPIIQLMAELEKYIGYDI